MGNSDKRSKAEIAREVSQILKATQPGSVGKVPAPFKSATKQSNEVAKDARQVTTSIVQGALESAKTEAQTVSFVNPTPFTPRAGAVDDVASAASSDNSDPLQPPDFPLATSPDGKPEMEHDPSGSVLEVNGASFRAFGHEGSTPGDRAQDGFVASQFNEEERVVSHSNVQDYIDWMPAKGKDVSAGIERDILDQALTGPTPLSAGHDVDVSIEKGVGESLVTPDPESLMSQGISDVLTMSDVGGDAEQRDDFDLIPEANMGTPFGGLPDAVPAANQKGWFADDLMQKEGAPDHVPNAEAVEMADGVATEAGEFAEAMADILERLAEKLQATMVRLRNVEAILERLV